LRVTQLPNILKWKCKKSMFIYISESANELWKLNLFRIIFERLWVVGVWSVELSTDWLSAIRRTVTRVLKPHPCSRLCPPVPPKFESIMEDQDLDAGETTRLAVVVEGKPDPDILWYKVRGLPRELWRWTTTRRNALEKCCTLPHFESLAADWLVGPVGLQDDALLSESSHCTFVYDDPECSLVVLNARPEDSGVYTCTAKNLAGAVSCKAEVTVHTGEKSTHKKHPWRHCCHGRTTTVVNQATLSLTRHRCHERTTAARNAPLLVGEPMSQILLVVVLETVIFQFLGFL